MKKLAMLIATLLIVCLMACACGTTPEASNEPTSEAPKSEAPASNEPTSQAPTSQAPTSEAPKSDAPTSEAPVTPPAAGAIIDFATRTELAAYTATASTALGADVVVGDFTLLGGCKYKALDPAKPKASSDGKYNFGWQVQLAGPSSSGAIGGSYAEKSIRFSTTGAATLTLYCNRSTSSAASGCQVRVVNDSEAEVAAVDIPGDGNKAYLITIAIPAAGNYALTGNAVTGVNVFGIGIA